MAVIITNKAEDVSARTQNGITYIERIMQAEGNTITEIVTSSKIPQPKSRHPYNSSFVLIDSQINPVGNLNRKVQVQIQMTYSNEGQINTDGNIDPWEQGAQNVKEDFITEQAPLLYGYSRDGKRFQLRNSAGSRLRIESKSFIRQISFSFCVKARSHGDAPVNGRAIINVKNEIVAGFRLAPFTAMLMPMTAAFVADVDDDGKVYRRYWQIQASILENEKTWMRSELNVGTMAIFGKEKVIQPIYQYKKGDETTQFGSGDDAQKAKNADKENVSYSEITEPMPLRKDGTLYLEAIKNPDLYPYETIDFFESKPVSWSKWNLPKSRA